MPMEQSGGGPPPPGYGPGPPQMQQQPQQAPPYSQVRGVFGSEQALDFFWLRIRDYTSSGLKVSDMVVEQGLQ